MKNENLENRNKKRNRIMIASIIGTLVILGGLTSYAFFQASGTKENEKVSVEAGNVELIFSDGTLGFSKELDFGSSAEKTFTIKNNGSVETVAKINWKNLTNTYLEESLTYSLNYTDEDNNTIEVVSNKNVPRSETPTTMELVNGITIPAGKTYTITLTITLNYLESTDQTADLNARFSSEYSIEEGDMPEPLVPKLLAKANPASITDYNSGVKGEMFTFSHPEATQTTGWTEAERTDYRYIGNTPNNYMNFNDETWRIIGVFTVEGENGEKEQRIKIIRDESIGKLSWNSNEVNEWPTSSLSALLNTGDYYKRTGTYLSNGLTEIAKSQIAPAKWYLGGSREYSNLGGPDYYNFERGTTTCATTGKCSGQTRSTSTIKNVGLMYPSDYVYTYANEVDSTCYSNGIKCNIKEISSYLYKNYNEYLISNNASYHAYVYVRGSSGILLAGNNVNNKWEIRPVVYLRSDIQVTDGDGSSVENAYVLSYGQF